MPSRLIPLLLLASLTCAQAQIFSAEEPLTISSLTANNETGLFNDLLDENGARVYADSAAKFDPDTIPDDFFNATLIRTRDADKDSNSTDVVSFTTNRDALICVWHSQDETNPGWIATDGYTDWNVAVGVPDAGETNFDAYCKIQSAGTYSFDGNTVSGTAVGPNYFITVQSSTYAAPDQTPSGGSAGEVRFVGTGSTLPEGSNGNFGSLERISGNSGAVSAVIEDDLSGTCSETGPDEYDVTGDTANWADGVSGTAADQATVTTSGKADISADCTVVLGIGTLTGGLTNAADNQTYTVTVTAAVTPGPGLYVDADTDPVGDGTSGNPYDDLQDAVNVASPGDTIYCQGRFADHDSDSQDAVINWPPGSSGTAGNMITLTQWPAQSTCIIGNLAHTTKAQADKYGIILRNADYIRIEGIRFETTWNDCISIQDDGSNASNNIEIVDNLLLSCSHVDHACDDGPGRNGIGFDPRAQNVLIDGNWIDSPGQSTANLTDCPGSLDPQTENFAYRRDHGLYVQGRYVTIVNNIFTNCLAGYCIKVDGADSSMGTLASDDYSHIIMNNTFGPNTNVSPYSSAGGSPVTIFNTAGDGPPPRWKFDNNLCMDVDDSSACVIITSSSNSQAPGPHYCRNNVVGSSSGYQSVCSTHESYVEAGVDVIISGNVTGQSVAQMDLTDIQDTYAAGADFTLGNSSSAEGAADCTLGDTYGDGSSYDAPSEDREGDTRSTTTCDSGMDEYVP